MEETPPKDQIALFRYGVIADLVSRPLAPGEKEKLLGAIADKTWDIPGTPRTHIGRTTVRDWIELYETHGFVGLKPMARADAGRSRAIPQEAQDLLLAMRTARRLARQPDPLRAVVWACGALAAPVAQRRPPLLRRPGPAGGRSVHGGA
jgi:hypothetical protein